MANIYPERMVAFIDILGFRALVESAKSNPSVIKQCSDAAILLTKITKSKRESRHPTLDILKKQVTNFSDSIVISYLTNCNNRQSEYYGDTTFYALSSIALDVTIIAKELAKLGLLIRGGVAIGNLHHQKATVMGEGLIKAYNIETSTANYPRVVVSDDIINRLPPLSEEYRIENLFEKRLNQDFDGMYMIDVLKGAHYSFGAPEEDFNLFISKYKEMVNQQLEGEKKLHLISKYRWLGRYINNFEEYCLNDSIRL